MTLRIAVLMVEWIKNVCVANKILTGTSNNTWTYSEEQLVEGEAPYLIFGNPVSYRYPYVKFCGFAVKI